MANRFGKSNWRDSDRLNLMLVCQEYTEWEDRVREMHAVYPGLPLGYFTPGIIREELERLMALPTPNLRLDVSKHFVFSRKIMFTKWIDYFTAEVRKQEAAAAETALVNLRSNSKMLKETLDKNTTSERLDELMKAVAPMADKHKNDANFKRTVGSVKAAMTDRLKTGVALDLEALSISATKPEGEADMPTGTQGFLTPTHPMIAADFYFSPMLSLADAVREAAPVPEPEAEPEIKHDFEFEAPAPEFVAPILASALAQAPEDPASSPEPEQEDIDFVVPMEVSPARIPTPEPTPTPMAVPEVEVPKEEVKQEIKKVVQKVEKEEEVQEEEEMEVDPTPPEKEKVIVPPSPKPVSQPPTPQKAPPKTPQKSPQKSPQKKIPEDVPLEVKMEEIKQEEDVVAPSSSTVPATPGQSPHGSTASASTSAAPTPRGRGRPRIVRGGEQMPVPSPKKKDTTATPIPTTPAASEEPSTSTPASAPAPSRTSKRLNESSQEPPPLVSSSRKPPRHLAAAFAAAAAASAAKKERGRKDKEGTEEPPSSSKGSSVPPMLRSESSFDITTAPASPAIGGPQAFREMEVQTDITIRKTVFETPMGERRRHNAPTTSAVPARRGRKSQLPADARSASRTSSASTPAPRGGSMVPVAQRSFGCQTIQRFEIEKDELIIMQVDPLPKVVHSLSELGVSRPIVVNEETCKEIDAENAALGVEPELGKKASKAESKREITFIVDTHEAIAKSLVAASDPNNDQSKDRNKETNSKTSWKVVSANCDMPTAHNSPMKRARRDEKAKEETNNIKYQLLTMHRALCECPNSDVFKKAVSKSEVEYHLAVKKQEDLGSIKRDIENGTINTVPAFMLRAYRMVANALVYNGWDHDVSKFARTMLDYALGDMSATSADGERRENPNNRRRSVKEETKDTSRSGSMDPEPMAPLGDVGTKRAIYRKSATNDHTMSTNGSRKSRRSLN